MPPKRKRGRPRHKLSLPLNSRQSIQFEISENISKEVMEYICSSCETSFKKKYKLIRHLETCNENISLKKRTVQFEPLHCTKCSKVFFFKKSFSKHIENEHYDGSDGVSCAHCHVTCRNKEVLKQHLDKKHKANIYACKYCSQTFVRKAHVTRHMLQKGCDGQKLQKFSCGICSSKFTRKDNLMVHLRLQHFIINKFQCKMCKFRTRNFSKLILHYQKMHLPQPLQYECDYCGKLTSTRGSLTKHLEIHGDKKYACGVCGYSTFTIEVMRRHTLTHVKNKPFQCNICPLSFIQRAQLVKHLDQHKVFTCKICRKRCKSKEELHAHENLHDADGTLSCPFEDCSERSLQDANELNKHLKEHLNVYKCEVCGKTFKNEGNMRRHVSTHELDRPRRCMYCLNPRAYVRGEHLLRHVRKHHADLFKQRLMHVRKVLGSFTTTPRVTKSELDAILNMLDAETDRIIEDCGTGVLFGGLQEASDVEVEMPKNEPITLLSEEELTENLKELLSKLIDQELLEAFGWPNQPIEEILEKVIENCGARAADRDKWSRVQRLRENTKHLFLYAVEDKNIAKMLSTHTIDQVIMHILEHVSDDTK